MLRLCEQRLDLVTTLLYIPNFLPSGFNLELTFTKFICVPYFSPNSSGFGKLCAYSTWKLEHILYLYPIVEISILGDFNVHH